MTILHEAVGRATFWTISLYILAATLALMGLIFLSLKDTWCTGSFLLPCICIVLAILVLGAAICYGTVTPRYYAQIDDNYSINTLYEHYKIIQRENSTNIYLIEEIRSH